MRPGISSEQDACSCRRGLYGDHGVACWPGTHARALSFAPHVRADCEITVWHTNLTRAGNYTLRMTYTQPDTNVTEPLAMVQIANRLAVGWLQACLLFPTLRRAFACSQGRHVGLKPARISLRRSQVLLESPWDIVPEKLSPSAFVTTLGE